MDKRLVAFLLALGFSVSSVAFQQDESKKVQPFTDLPNTIVIRVDTNDGDNESNPTYWLMNVSQKIENEANAKQFIPLVEEKEGTPLKTGMMDKDSPDDVTALVTLMEKVYDNPHPAWRYGHYHGSPYFYGYGRGAYYGYAPPVLPYRRPHYGFYHRQRFYPYYPAPYYYAPGPYRYYFYHSPYFRW